MGEFSNKYSYSIFRFRMGVVRNAGPFSLCLGGVVSLMRVESSTNILLQPAARYHCLRTPEELNEPIVANLLSDDKLLFN